MLPYRERLAFDQRRKAYEQITQRRPDLIPFIVERHNKRDTPALDKEKFLLPHDITMAQLKYVIKKRISPFNKAQALFLFVKGSVPTSTSTAQQVKSAYQDEDGFVYVTYALENTFG